MFMTVSSPYLYLKGELWRLVCACENAGRTEYDSACLCLADVPISWFCYFCDKQKTGLVAMCFHRPLQRSLLDERFCERIFFLMYSN